MTKANAAQETANNAVTKANAAQETANNAMPKSGGTFTGGISATLTGTLISSDDRLTSVNVPHVCKQLRYFIAKTNMTGGPPADAKIIHLSWDGTSGDDDWDSQIAISNSGNQLYFRTKNASNVSQWLSWEIVMKKSQFSVRGSTLNISI